MTMETLAAVIDFITLLFQTALFVAGLMVGVLATLAVRPFFRLQRQIVLRRKWKNDEPRTVTTGLFPEWQDDDPDMPGIAKRCVCHGRKIYPGERVLTWPETGPMNLLHVAVYCESVKEKLWGDDESNA
jgi:hypothetical protein